MTRSRENDTTKTRQKIIEATDALISEKGLAASSVSAVARTLGMSHANVYRHFKTKDALLMAVAETWMQETRDACEDAFDRHAAIDQNLANLVLAIRKELFRRAKNVAALDLYHFALKHMPDAAVEHHKHRAGLVDRITQSPRHTPVLLDALRSYIDPNLLLATESPDTIDRINKLCAFLERSLQHK